MSESSAAALTNPFVGLRAFEEKEDYLFFGRGKQISELLTKFHESRFLAVIGSSGSGKSSLVKSGLLPSIYSGFMTVGTNWRVAVMRPGENPIGYLTKELAADGTLFTGTDKLDVPYESIIEASLRRSENGLVQVYKDAHLPGTENLLIVVDQFEELFRFNKYERLNKSVNSDSIHFIQILLAAALQREHPIYVLLTMRSDFLGDCAEFRGLPEAINKGQYLVPRMIRDQIREAITGPVAVSTATITQRLVTRLLNDINNDTDQLPILQHAMMRTWDAWYKRNRITEPIDFEDYDKIGTMRTALSQHADEAYAELGSEKDRKICELMFKALTESSADLHGIRRPRSVADLCLLTSGTPAEVIKEVEIFRKPGRTFLMPPRGVALTEESIIDISHESLMRVWQRLVKWTEEEMRSGAVFLRLANSAQLKEQGQRGLLKNPELEITLNWKEKNKPVAKWAEGYKANFEQAMTYLEDSREADLAEKKSFAAKEASRKRLVKTIFIMLAFLLVASILASLYFNGLKRKAEDATRKAVRSDSLTKSALRAAQLSQIKATQSANEATVSAQEAAASAAIAEQRRHQADSNAAIAQQNQMKADSNASVAEQQTKEAVAAKSRADSLREQSNSQNIKIAANEYARLIREGPSVENKNKNDFYTGNYLLAYQYHFARLEAYANASGDNLAYQVLKNKLNYNNDLYQQVYEALAKIDKVKEVIKEDKNLKNYSTAKLAGVDFPAGRLKIDRTGKLAISNMTNGGKAGSDTMEFISFAVSKVQQKIFCASNDNLIYVFDNKLNKLSTINMGAKVTALDFNDDRSIIYFGTSGGYIGYILYGKNKNQPVFANRLESDITALQFFKYPQDKVMQPFLLATGLRSSPRLYKLDNNTPQPDSRLFGNIMPYTEKQYGRVTYASFDNENNLVTLFTTKGTFSWDPFTYNLLNKLQSFQKFNPEEKSTQSWLNKPEFKFY